MKKLPTLMERLPESLDAALITAATNRFYYTSFPSSAGVVVVTREQSYLIIDGRYHEAALENAVDCEVILQDKVYQQIDELLKKHNVKNLGLESDTMSLSEYQEYKNKLSSYNIVADRTLSAVISEQRAVKSEQEKEYVQKSQDITDKTFEHALEILKPGKTEKEIALEMEFYSRQIGSEEPSFSFIVAAGSSTSRPHAVPSDNKIKKGDFVLMDFGCTYEGYRSDMTRTVAVGEPSEKQKEVYNIVLQAQKKAMENIKPGVACNDVHQVALDFIDATDYKGLFTHGLGHSLGLDIHEAPNFNPTTTHKLVPGNLLSVEPGIYIPGEFGVRIEDIIYITEDGFYNFTHSPKELIIL